LRYIQTESSRVKSHRRLNLALAVGRRAIPKIGKIQGKEIIIPRPFPERSIEQLRLTRLTINLTDECNFSCAYCYQRKGRQRVEFAAIVKVIDFLHRYFAPDCFVEFHGGEPLLALDELKQTVAYVDGLTRNIDRKVRYSLATNGSFLTADVLDFLDEHEFLLALSFDGLAQDISRKKGTFAYMVSLIPQILARSGISLETNSVFSSKTVDRLAESVEFIVRMGIRKIGLSLAHKPQWDSHSLLRFEREIGRLRKDFACRFEDVKDVPWAELCKEPEEGVHGCPAGVEQMALSVQGTLWGCPVFPYYFADKSKSKESRKYCFGNVDSFIKNPYENYAQKMANYSGLRMDCYETPKRPCVMCPEIERCSICPLAAALTTDDIGRIPAWTCQSAKIVRRERRILLDEFEKRTRKATQKSSG